LHSFVIVKMEEKQFTRKDAHKINILALAEHHRRCCDGEGCTISLMLLKELAEAYGIKFTEEEFKLFV